VADARRTLLEPTSVTLETGEIVAVHGDPGHRHTLLTLALGGRLVPSGGEVAVDGDDTAEARQQKVALALTTVVGEELAMAGQPARRTHVDDWLTGRRSSTPVSGSSCSCC
jgi:ABC-type hemin transport system ATPase subunit